MLPRSASLAILIVAVLLTAAVRTAGAADGYPICGAAHDQFGPAVASDASGGAYVAWLDQRLGYNTDVYVQRVDHGGKVAPGWPVDGLGVTYVTCHKDEIAIAGDGSGAWLAWADNRCSAGAGFDVYCSRVTSKGAFASGFAVNGVSVRAVPGDQTHPAIVSDGAGGIYLAWTDLASVPAHLVLQHVRANGTLDPAWPSAGLTLSSTVPDSARAALLGDGGGGVLAAWQDSRGSNADLYLQRVTSSGAFVAGWPATGRALCTALGDQSALRGIGDGAGGGTFVWCDKRSGSAKLYARRVDANGASAAGWVVDGNPVATAAGEQSQPALMSDGSGGVFVAWRDTRNGGSAPDLYAQRLDGSATLLWGSAGAAALVASGGQAQPQLASDGSGGVFVACADGRALASSGGDVAVARLTSSGVPAAGWSTSGVVLCDAAGEQREPRLVSDGGSGAFAVWTDARSVAGSDIAMRPVTASGAAGLEVTGLQAVHHDGQTFLTWNTPPGTGWTYHIYRANTAITSGAMLTPGALVGSVGDSSAYDRRLSNLLHVPYGLCLDSLATPRDPASGLYVHTPGANGAGFYAVTVRNGSFNEDTLIVSGANTLTQPVSETLAPPRPVYQRDIHVGPLTVSVWSLFCTPRETPLLEAMGNEPGLVYDVGIVRAAPASMSSLVMPLHYRSGSFLDGIYGTGAPGEWVLALDDYLPNGLDASWYGYADSYDIHTPAIAPLTSGTVVDYTLRRCRFTLDWALRTFPIDPARVYAYGYSMGGAGATQFALHFGDRLAAVMSVVGKYDFGKTDDPDTTCWYNTYGNLRKISDSMWGQPGAHLPALGGGDAYTAMSAAALAASPASRAIPPMILFSGKRDVTMGWAEKPAFYAAMQTAHRGGLFYWDNSTHSETSTRPWTPMQDVRELFRWRSDRSFPAISHCSLDGAPGDGHANSGDSLGAIGAMVEWDTTLTDSTKRWECTLRLRALTSTYGTWTPPDSCTLDVTPRRVQRLHLVPGTDAVWSVRRASDGANTQSGRAPIDADGVVTLTGLRIQRAGSIVRIEPDPLLAAPPPIAARPRIALGANPARGRTALSVIWPASGPAEVALFDVAGRRVRTLFAGEAGKAPLQLALDTRDLSAGLYLVRARVAGNAMVARLVVSP